MQACCAHPCGGSGVYHPGGFPVREKWIGKEGNNALKCCNRIVSRKLFKRVKYNAKNSKRNAVLKKSNGLQSSLFSRSCIEKSSSLAVEKEDHFLKDLHPPTPLRIINTPNFDEKILDSSLLDESVLPEKEAPSTHGIESFGTSLETESVETPSSSGIQNSVSDFFKKASTSVEKIFSGISPRIRGLILLNILTALYGSNITVVKEAQESLDASVFNAGRFAIASLAFSPWIPMAIKDEDSRNAGIELGIWAILGYATQAFGLLSTGAGRASFLCTFTVIEVPIIAGLFGAKIPPVTWFAAASALIGVSLLESPGVSSSLLGDFWCLISALFFGIHMLRSEHHSQRISPQNAVSMIGLQMGVMAVFSTLWASLIHKDEFFSLISSTLGGDFSPLASSVETVPWPLMIYTGVISTACCLWIEIVTLRNVSATEAAMVYSLEPLYGACFAWVLLGERWGLKGWFGALLVVGGSLCMQIFGGKGDKSNDFEGQSTLIQEEFDSLDSPIEPQLENPKINIWAEREECNQDTKKDA